MQLNEKQTSPAILVLQDGSIFEGQSIGAIGETVGELVFNTSMSGYQEILTDPSYAQQIVTLTYPHIGNTGTNEEDAECERIWAKGLVIRDLPLLTSNFRSQKSLCEYLQVKNIVGICEIDTRRLTRILRDKGAQSACIIAGDRDQTRARQLAGDFPGIKGADLAKVVTTKQPYFWAEGSWQLSDGFSLPSQQSPYKVVAYDFGVKRNILRMLADRGCELTVVPAQTSAAEVLAMKPDGVFLSNGPGDPEPCGYAIEAIQTLLDRAVPMFGICLGHQLLALASGAKTVKMKFGHHGANHPVQSLADGRVMITSQNHGFTVDDASLPDTLVATHRSLFDGSLQGIRHQHKPAFSFQGHPEASPGPHDVADLFDQFTALMQTHA